MHSTGTHERRPIGSYGVIGDCGTIALVTDDARIDWLCLPRFDSPSVFGALLDPDRGGYWWVRPSTPYRSTRRYLERTNILVTDFETESGILRVTDFMAVGDIELYETTLKPDHQTLRRIECLEGEVDVRADCVPRTEYGRRAARFVSRRSLGFFSNEGALVLAVRSELPLRLNRDGSALRGRERLSAGDVRWMTLVQDEREPAVLPVLGKEAERRLEQSIEYWRSWSDLCAYDGPYSEHVMRSALVLKLLTFSASGAVVAAATTSLPETLGGHKNWDYRYCWLRDASFTLRALLELGYMREGQAFFSWLLHSTRRTLPRLDVLYDVLGTQRTQEQDLDHLQGYADSRPVRIGNGAREQFQLDTYGTLISAAVEYCRLGGSLGRWQQRMLRKLGQAIMRRWKEPDNGIWESRGPRIHHTFSIAMCVVGLEGLIELHDNGELRKGPVEEWRACAEQIRRDVDHRGWNESLGSYVSELGGREVDASLLLLPIYGYLEADDPPMKQTFEHLRNQLAVGSQWYRFTESWRGRHSAPEGTFGICGFWSVEVLTRQGRLPEATQEFEAMLETSNDLGLFSEEFDPHTDELLGNFPQAFTHVGLINAALSLAEPVGHRMTRASPDYEPGRHPTLAEAKELSKRRRQEQEQEEPEVGA